MRNVLIVDGKIAECTVSEQELRIVIQGRKPKESTIALDDVIVIEKNDVALNASTDQSKSAKPKWLGKVHYITRKKLIWKQATLCITGQVLECQQFISDLQLHFQKVCDLRPKRFLVLVNPISGGRYGQRNSKRILPMFERAGITCDVKVSERAKHFEEMVTEYDFSTVDGIVIFGGDGSFSEVLNRLLRISHDKAGANFNDINGPFIPCTIPMGIIPSGTGNGISSAEYGNYDVVTAALHIIKGNTCKIPLVADYSADELIGYGSVVTAYGLFGDIMYFTDQKRWMRRARYPVMSLYMIMLKTHRLFNAEITLTGSQLNQEDSEKEEKMDGEFSNVSFFPAEVFGQAKGTWMVIVFRQFSRLDFIRLMGKMVNREMLQEGEIPTITLRQPSRIRIKVKPKDLGDKNFLNYLMNIDGEIHTMKQADVTMTSLPNAVSVYSSLHLYPDSVSPPRTSTSAPSPDSAAGT
ncbi:ceramide kinase-like [Mizuhopecten yessoensis]|uniref:Ceramide kinase n=1 Tax=Mizuhopecten yessoensis TaxID=6573 RepID=A0A210PE20_MIZYE|nr:ceramide kinase-like [Mizuhopecten yessoensis]OWF34749.1 Ceramide kinase [Mizuhopecten yessoensis]